MGTTYCGTGFRVMFLNDNVTKENLLKYYVKTETNALYVKGIDELKALRFSDYGYWLIQSFANIPVQMCLFHRPAIIHRDLTKKPKLKTVQELMEIIHLVKQAGKESFEEALQLWIDKRQDFLNGRTINLIATKSFYTYKRLRGAYRSLQNNILWILIW